MPLCSALLDDPDHLRHALDAVDAVVGNLGPLPAPMAAMLFQSGAQAGGAAPALALSAAASCPRIGLQLSVEGDRNPLTAPLPDADFTCLEAVISNVSCQFGVTSEALSCALSQRPIDKGWPVCVYDHGRQCALILCQCYLWADMTVMGDAAFCSRPRDSPSGVMRLTVESIGLSGQQSVDNLTKEHLLKSPSIAANRMLQARTSAVLQETCKRFPQTALRMHSPPLLA